MCGKEIGKFVCNGLHKTKTGILSLMGMSADAFNEYEVSLKVTEHGKGANEEHTGSLNYQKKYKIDLGNAILVGLGIISAVSIVVLSASLCDKD